VVLPEHFRVSIQYNGRLTLKLNFFAARPPFPPGPFPPPGMMGPPGAIPPFPPTDGMPPPAAMGPPGGFPGGKCFLPVIKSYGLSKRYDRSSSIPSKWP